MGSGFQNVPTELKFDRNYSNDTLNRLHLMPILSKVSGQLGGRFHRNGPTIMVQ